MMNRSSGILLHITSLPSPYGVGNLGKAAFDFVDFLKKAGQSYWQILPICPPGYGDSPYQAFSTFAGNPYLIDPDQLVAAARAAEGMRDTADVSLIEKTGKVGKLIARCEAYGFDAIAEMTAEGVSVKELAK